MAPTDFTILLIIVCVLIGLELTDAQLEVRLLCSYHNYDACIGVSAGDGHPRDEDYVQLKGRIQNEYENNTWKSTALALYNNTIELYAYPHLSIRKIEGSTHAIWSRDNGTEFIFERVNLTVRIMNNNSKCLTIMTCGNKEGFCDKDTWRPVKSSKQIKSGNYVKYRNCTSGNDIAQLFIENPQCAPGCTDEMLDNNVCDQECNTKSCKWDLRTCPRITTSPSLSPTMAPSFLNTILTTILPTFLPTASPTFTPTISPTSTPTPNPSMSPTFAPTFDPTFAPTTSPTVLPTTMVPTTSPTEDTETPTTQQDLTDSPTEEPQTAQPTRTPATEQPVQANNTTKTPTFEYEVYEKTTTPTIFITKSPSSEAVTSEPEDEMAQYEDTLNTIRALEQAILAFVVMIFILLAYWFYLYLMHVRQGVVNSNDFQRRLTGLAEKVDGIEKKIPAEQPESTMRSRRNIPSPQIPLLNTP